VLVPDPAATVLALRPTPGGFEVLMVQRNARGFFGSIVVFPGGKVEAEDVPEGLSADDDLCHRNAAVREFAEETGIAIPGGVDDLTLVSRWVTPEMAPRRFDTRFYVVGLVDPPDVVLDTEELLWHLWVTPGEALEHAGTGEWAMIKPTLSHLHWLSRWTSIEEAVASAQGADGRTLIIPRVVEDGSILPIHLPAEVS
jgi:8-oxo-dGTP pyrophosphatase MutT (NUDIX family)